MDDRACCFIGHRNIDETEELIQQVYSIIENLIINEGVSTFFFGSKSLFNSLCYELVTKLKEKYPYIKRIYARAEFPHINQSYRDYLLENYEDTYYPASILHAGRAAYVERNCEMIDKSFFCVVYYKEECLPKNRKSGTKKAYEYAVRMKKQVILLSL